MKDIFIFLLSSYGTRVQLWCNSENVLNLEPRYFLLNIPLSVNHSEKCCFNRTAVQQNLNSLNHVFHLSYLTQLIAKIIKSCYCTFTQQCKYLDFQDHLQKSKLHDFLNIKDERNKMVIRGSCERKSQVKKFVVFIMIRNYLPT